MKPDHGAMVRGIVAAKLIVMKMLNAPIMKNVNTLRGRIQIHRNRKGGVVQSPEGPPLTLNRPTRSTNQSIMVGTGGTWLNILLIRKGLNA